MKIIKTIFLMLCTLMMMQSCIVSSGKSDMTYFSDSGEKFKGAKFTSMNLPMFLAKPIIKKALREDGEDHEDVIRIIKKISKVKVLTVENGDKSMLRDFAAYLNNNNYEDWATIMHDGDRINIRVKQKGDAIKNMLITINSKQELLFVDVKGNFTSGDISRLIASASDK